MTRVYVPGDAAARAMGADRVVRALRALPGGESLELVRTGSRGMHFLEPLVEVDMPDGSRRAYGPVTPGDVASLHAAGFLTGGEHALGIGRPEAHPFLSRQTRVTFRRCGVVDPTSLSDYAATGGLVGLERARSLGPDATIEAVVASSLRGRGGAGFPTGIKWRTVRSARGERKAIVCNADEGDSGTFADRMLMEGDPFLLIEGMAIAAFAVGAQEGWVYLRSEYPHAARTFEAALNVARAAGILVPPNSGAPGFDLQLRIGAGSYVCGEETALLESLEGRRGQVRAKPPLPAHHGLFGRPTVVNNVLSLAAVPDILADGPDAWAAHGTGRSRGTMPVQLAGNVKYGGLVEVPFGCTLGDLVYGYGGGTASGRPVRAVQCGGPLGAWLPTSLFDTVYDFETFTAIGALVGHGGVVVADDTVDMAHMARFAFEFAAEESCGKCTPCRIGSVRGAEVIARIQAGETPERHLALISDLCHTLKLGSLCALGGFLPYPVESAIRYFPEDFTGVPRAAARS